MEPSHGQETCIRTRGHRERRYAALALACLAFSSCATLDLFRPAAKPDASAERAAPVRQAMRRLSLADAPLPAVSAATPADVQISAIIDHMTLREKIAQHFIAWVPRGGDRMALEVLKDLQPGGYILYPWNYGSIEEARALTALLSDVDDGIPATVDVRPFLCVDQEGGRVAAFRFPEYPAVPSAFRLGSLGNPAVVEEAAYVTALELASLGVNMDLAPVADLYPKADETVIGDRSFGPDPAATSASVAAWVRGLMRGGIIPTVKHFPGHGITTVDSHAALPVVDASLESLRSRELVPFAEGIRAGAPVVMTAHILYPAIDAERPATLSPAILKDLLRGEMGFDGIILTDGFEMGALAGSWGKVKALAAALEAGVTCILLYNNYAPAQMIDIMEQLVRDHQFSVEAIDRNLRRILKVKKEYGLLGGR